MGNTVQGKNTSSASGLGQLSGSEQLSWSFGESHALLVQFKEICPHAIWRGGQRSGVFQHRNVVIFFSSAKQIFTVFPPLLVLTEVNQRCPAAFLFQTSARTILIALTDKCERHSWVSVSTHTPQKLLLLLLLFSNLFGSIKCQKKVENTHQSFPKETYSVCLFCLISSPKSKDVVFIRYIYHSIWIIYIYPCLVAFHRMFGCV